MPRLLLLAALLASLAPSGSGRILAAGLPGAPGGQPAEPDPYTLPKDLLIGAGVSAIQTEGAWDLDGKGESAADHVVHTGKLGPLGFQDPHQHDVAADSYHKYKEDVAMAAKLKLKLYRLSISWSRVLPTADVNNVSKAGVDYYDRLLDEIISHNMTPMVTLHHFDHPQVLEDQFHGFQSSKMVDKFAEYALFAFKQWGASGKVKLWTTINEPNMYCTYFPALFKQAGLYEDKDVNTYDCMRNAVLAHAKAYRNFKSLNIEGQVGATALIMNASPKTTRTEDIYAAEAFNQVQAGLVLNPVVNGDFPDMVKELVGNKIAPFSDAEKQLINGTTDFIGFNVYFSMVATYNANSSAFNPMAHIPVLGSLMDNLPFVLLDLDGGIDPQNPMGMFSYIRPNSIRNAVLWTWNNYKLPLVITENGFGDTEKLGKRDHKRAVYHSAFLRTLVSTMKTYSIPVKAYCVWSLIDAFEWSAGYDRPFGLVHVDYENENRTRSLKDSAFFWTQLAETGVVPLVESSSGTISSSCLALLIFSIFATTF